MDRLAEVLELGQLVLDAGLFEDAVDQFFCIHLDQNSGCNNYLLPMRVYLMSRQLFRMFEVRLGTESQRIFVVHYRIGPVSSKGERGRNDIGQRMTMGDNAMIVFVIRGRAALARP